MEMEDNRNFLTGRRSRYGNLGSPENIQTLKKKKLYIIIYWLFVDLFKWLKEHVPYERQN